jgi:hypothetical protein
MLFCGFLHHKTQFSVTFLAHGVTDHYFFGDKYLELLDKWLKKFMSSPALFAFPCHPPSRQQL